MRILAINHYYPPDTAQSAWILSDLCQDLAARNPVLVICGRPSYDVSGGPGRAAGRPIEPGADGVDVYRAWSTTFARSSMLGRLTNYASFLGSAVIGTFTASRPDIVLTMTDPPIVAGVAALVSLVRRVPFLYIVQDVHPDAAVAQGLLANRTAIWAFECLSGFLLARATIIVAVGRDMQTRLERHGVDPAKIRVIENWADEAIIRPISGESRFRRSLGLSDAFVVMHSGNVGHSQNLDLLRDAAAVWREAPRIRFLIVGQGATRQRLETRVRGESLDNVTFRGYRPREDLSDTLAAGDVHYIGMVPALSGAVVPSKLYGIMAAARPFVAAVEPGTEPAMVAEATGCGVRVDPTDAEALADAILRLARQPSERAAMGIAALETYRARYTRTIATARYEALIESVVTAAQGQG